MPVLFLKYFPKNEELAKFNSSAISCMVLLEYFSSALAESMTYSSIHTLAVFPLTLLTAEEKCLGVRNISLA